MTGLEGKTAIVTGAGSGIGRAAAFALASRKVAVVVADIDEIAAFETVAAIHEFNGAALATKVDVTKEGDVRAMVELTLSRFGELQIAVNAAGGGDRRGKVGSLSEDDFDFMISLNLKSVFLSMRHEIEAIRRRDSGGSIINIASTAAVKGIKSSSLYAAAKHGVVGLSKCSALDYASENIRINAICPGAIDTPQFQRVLASRFPDLASDEARSQMSKSFALGRIGKPEEVADMVLWLASDQSSYMTGQALVLDGGGAG